MFDIIIPFDIFYFLENCPAVPEFTFAAAYQFIGNTTQDRMEQWDAIKNYLTSALPKSSSRFNLGTEINLAKWTYTIWLIRQFVPSSLNLELTFPNTNDSESHPDNILQYAKNYVGGEANATILQLMELYCKYLKVGGIALADFALLDQNNVFCSAAAPCNQTLEGNLSSDDVHVKGDINIPPGNNNYL